MRTKPKLIFVAGAALGAAVLAGRAGGAQQSPANVACRLISAAEARQVTGIAFSEGQPIGADGATSGCGWDRPSGGGLQVTVYLQNAAGAYQQTISLPGFAPVAGIGDRAAWSGMLHTFIAQRGARTFAIKFNFGAGDQRAWAETLARKALARL
jgi:hypothetical protein